jgi:acyl carrier protein
MSVIENVREYLVTELRIAQADELDPDLPLVQRGVIDSIELMQVVLFLENRYTITIDETEVLPSNLRSLSTIQDFVAAKMSAAGVEGAVE